MDCPRCTVPLKVEGHKGLDVDRCPKCQGLWLDYSELDELEDKVMEDDSVKGTMMFRSHGGELSCPKCSTTMEWFRYRHYDMEIDFCTEQHGFWLDKGEEKRVIEIMEQRTKDLKRSASAEAQWDSFLAGMKSKGFMSKVRDLFKRR